MDISQCKHIRVRDNNDYNMDIEEFIKSIEIQFKINFTSLPQWRELIEIMNIVKTDYKTKFQNATNRKYQILQNIFTQNSRPTPFELTDKLARTSKFWQDMKLNLKTRKISKVKNQPSEELDDMQEILGEVFTSPTNASQQHPNTEEVQSNQAVEEKQEKENELNSPVSPHLPVNICTNPHKTVSPLGSNYTPLISPVIELCNTELMSRRFIDKPEDQLLPAQTKLVKSYPNKIIITKDTTKKQTMKLYLTNCCTEYLHLQFKNISVNSYFKSIKIFPYTPVKLYPGLTVVFKLTYALKTKNIYNITSSIHFRISRNVLSETSEEVFNIPIESSFIKSRIIDVTETVYIPPNYSWQVTPKCGYPKALVFIRNTDDASYYLHIRKRIVDFAKECAESIKSVDVISPSSESLVQRIEDKDIEHHSTMLSTPNIKQGLSSHFDELNDDSGLVNSIDIVGLVLTDIIDLVLEPFIFKHTYLRIPPRSRKFVIVYFTKMHHVGCHQSYYNLTFKDCEDEDITITKTIKVLGEVLPHPISIQPKILDMSKSPVIFGYCEDYITITNSHKVFPVIIKIKTTSKMKKIFNITPRETVVCANTSANFNVRICTRKNIETIESDELAYFTIKIVIIGHKSVYKNVPPIYYEIVIPCASEFKRIYGTEYFKDIIDSSDMNVNDIVSP